MKLFFKAFQIYRNMDNWGPFMEIDRKKILIGKMESNLRKSVRWIGMI